MIQVTFFDKKTNLFTANHIPTLFRKLIKTIKIIKILKNSKINTTKKKRVKK